MSKKVVNKNLIWFRLVRIRKLTARRITTVNSCKLETENRVVCRTDDNDLRYLLVKVFSREGVEVYPAADSHQGLRGFYEHRPDLVILDIMLPDQDGWQTYVQLRRLADTPVIFLTALEKDDDDDDVVVVVVVKGLDFNGGKLPHHLLHCQTTSRSPQAIITIQPAGDGIATKGNNAPSIAMCLGNQGIINTGIVSS